VRLLLHDTFLTAPLVHPFKEGWVESHDFELVYFPKRELPPVTADDIALLPAGGGTALEMILLGRADIAVVADQEGPISLRAPVRPDEIERSVVRLLDVTPSGEVLARATITPFFGIEVTEWTTEASADAQVVILEGAAALREPQGGYHEDLCRSWFILTNMTTVTYVLVAPLGADRRALEPVLSALVAAQGLAKTQRRAIRRAVAAATELPLPSVNACYDRLFFSLDEDDRRSLALMLKQGTAGSRFPNVSHLTYLEATPGNEVSG